jgi:hypothetical protein
MLAVVALAPWGHVVEAAGKTGTYFNIGRDGKRAKKKRS